MRCASGRVRFYSKRRCAIRLLAVRLLAEQTHSFFGDVERLLFVPYALRDHGRYVGVLTGKCLNPDHVLDGRCRANFSVTST